MRTPSRSSVCDQLVECPVIVQDVEFVITGASEGADVDACRQQGRTGPGAGLGFLQSPDLPAAEVAKNVKSLECRNPHAALDVSADDGDALGV